MPRAGPRPAHGAPSDRPGGELRRFGAAGLAELVEPLSFLTELARRGVRAAIFEGDRARAVARFGFANADNALPCVYVTGGAQGARVLNRAVEAALPELVAACRLVHQCGRQPEGSEQDFDRLSAEAAKLPPPLRQRYFLTRFVGDEIGDVFAGNAPGRGSADEITLFKSLGLAIEDVASADHIARKAEKDPAVLRVDLGGWRDPGDA